MWFAVTQFDSPEKDCFFYREDTGLDRWEKGLFFRWQFSNGNRYTIPIVPKQKNYSRIFSINNFQKNQKCELIWIRYRNITNYLHFGENPIRFASVVTKKLRFLLGMSWVHSIQVLHIHVHLHKPFKRSVEFNAHLIVYISVSILSVKIWMEGTCDMPYKNPYFIVTTEPNWMGFSLKCR